MKLRAASKICVSVAETNTDSFVKSLMRLQAYGMELAEIRIDALEASERTGENIKRIFNQPIKLVATCRLDQAYENVRKNLLLAAVGCKAAYVDIEVGAPEIYRAEISSAASVAGCKTIISYHDFGKTPSREELERIVERCFESGADIAKISCMVNSATDSARLLGLLGHGRPLIVSGMGEKSRLVRIMAPLLGSEFTYASIETGGETALGQMDMLEVKKLLEDFIRTGCYVPE